MRSSHGLLRPGRFLWARVLLWSVVFGAALWIAYKFVKGAIIGLGLGGTGLPTTIGVLATLALYTASVRLIERRSPDELGLAQRPLRVRCARKKRPAKGKICAAPLDSRPLLTAPARGGLTDLRGAGGQRTYLYAKCPRFMGEERLVTW